MGKHFVVVVLMVTSLAMFAEAGAYRGELIRISGLFQSKNYQAAITALHGMIRNPSTPGWVRASNYCDLAYAYALTNQKENAVDAFEKAVNLGFNDFTAVQEQPAIKAYYSDARFRQAYGRMRISPADLAELYWLKSETQHVVHDTTMMITENEGRVDRDYTETPQSQIPTRPNASTGVLIAREVLAIVQGMQRDNVRQSDINRINHLMQMQIISNTGGDGSGGVTVEQAQESARQAAVRARNRRTEIAARPFVMPASASNSPAPVPAL